MKLAVLSSLFVAGACFAQPGALDLSFNPGSGPSGSASRILAMSLTPSGQILVAGFFTAFNGFPSQYVARLNADGSFDPTFYVGTGPDEVVSTVASEANGDVLISGSFSSVNGLYQPHMARLRADGSLDLTFTNIANAGVNALVNLNNGGCLAAGYFSSVNGITMNNLARFSSNGNLDMSFNPAAISGGSGSVQAVAVQSNGFVVIGSDFTSVGGYSYQCVARLNAAGDVDTSFVGPGLIGPSSSAITAIVIETNGQMIVGGRFTSIDGYSELGVARLNSDGSLDTTFLTAVGTTSTGVFALQNNGKVLEEGTAGLERLNADGSLDRSFAVTVPAYGVYSMAVQPDGKILLAGGFSQVDGTNISGIARLLGDSALQAGVQLLNMNLYPGMFLSGSIGTNYRVEYATNLTSPSLWTPLTILTLTNTPTFVPDPTLPKGSRFYRAVTLP